MVPVWRWLCSWIKWVSEMSTWNLPSLPHWRVLVDGLAADLVVLLWVLAPPSAPMSLSVVRLGAVAMAWLSYFSPRSFCLASFSSTFFSVSRHLFSSPLLLESGLFLGKCCERNKLTQAWLPLPPPLCPGGLVQRAPKKTYSSLYQHGRPWN